MVDLKVLEQRGITQASLKQRLQGDPWMAGGKAPEMWNGLPQDPALADDRQKVQWLLNRIRSRINEAITRNMNEFRSFYALDLAWNTPFRQITPTLVAQFMDSNVNDETVYKAFQDWGLTNLITESTDPKDPTKTIRTLNQPVFFKVLVPLVKAYVTIRWAKIMNDRRLTPFFKYEPVKMTTPLQLKCDVITDRIQIMSNQYGYFDVMKQGVLKMLHYGTCLQFPKEEWHREEQCRKATKEDVLLGKKGKEGKVVSEGDEITVTEREGLRYHHPHPTRCFSDMAHGAYTYNYDSGCMFGGYWNIRRLRDLQGVGLWNLDKIALGMIDLVGSNRSYFTTVYSSCTMNIPCFAPAPAPKTPDGAVGAAAVGVGPGPLDREKELALMYYGSDHMDQGVLVTEYFEKLVPKDCGLGNYEYPVWFRFLVAGDGCTVLYAAPLPYAPIIYYGYDADESQTKNASMSLEALPFQDQFSNMLTQILLTARQNLANLVLVDESQLDPKGITWLKNLGEGFYRFLNVIGFDGKKAHRAQNKIVDAAQSITFPKGNVAELTNVLKTILDVLERVLVMSSQEVAQAASHEQTREEIRNIAGNTSSRLIFTATPVDIARNAWKRQLYEAVMQYGDDDFYAHIPSDIPINKDVLTAMGFTFVDHDMDKALAAAGKTPKYYRAKVPRWATAIPLWELADNRDGEDRTNSEKIATTLATVLQTILNNPMTAQAIGPDQALDFINKLCYFAGLPRDMKFRNASPEQSPEQKQAEAQAQLKQVIDAVMQLVDQKMQKDIEPLLKEVSKNDGDIALIMKVLNLAAPNPANDIAQPTTAPNAGAGPAPQVA